jgi:hypothetical protein
MTRNYYNDMHNYYEHMSYFVNMLIQKYGCTASDVNNHHLCMFIQTSSGYKPPGHIYLGENSTRRLPGRPISTHAEMSVLDKITRHKCIKTRKNNFDVLVIRISKNNTLGISRPCRNCIQSMLKNRNITINNIYYSVNTSPEGVHKIVREKLNEMLDSPLTTVSTGWRKRTMCSRSGQNDKNNSKNYKSISYSSKHVKFNDSDDYSFSKMLMC